MVEKFELTNARGISVGINNFKLMSYTPTGLGVKFNNNYNNYQTYFKLTKQSLSQGQFNAKILFGSVVSETFDSFQKFSEFLAYQPYTMTYTSDSGTWNREAMLSEMTKSEIGSSSYDPNLLDESFTLEFINNWYNNKTAEYKSYDPDPNLGTYGKIYGNQIADTSIKPSQVNSKGQTNKLANTEFSPDFSGWTNNGWTLATDTPSYLGSNVMSIANPASTRNDISQTLVVTPGTVISMSTYLKLSPRGSETAPAIRFTVQFLDSSGNVISTVYSTNVTTKIGFTLYKVENALVPNGAVSLKFRVYADNYVYAWFVQPMLVFDTTVGDYVQGLEYNHVATPAYTYAYAPYYVYQESNRPSNEKVMSLNNKSQYFGLQSGSPSVITVNGPCSVNPTWTVVQNGNVVATDGFVLTLTDNQKLVVSSYPEDQYARLYNPDGSYVDVSQLQDYTKTNFVQIPEGESTVLFYLDANSDVNITFKEERLLV